MNQSVSKKHAINYVITSIHSEMQTCIIDNEINDKSVFQKTESCLAERANNSAHVQLVYDPKSKGSDTVQLIDQNNQDTNYLQVIDEGYEDKHYIQLEEKDCLQLTRNESNDLQAMDLGPTKNCRLSVIINN